MTQRFEDLADRLDAIGEELADAGIEVLTNALSGSASHDRATDKALASARRSVHKAAERLRSIDAEPAD